MFSSCGQTRRAPDRHPKPDGFGRGFGFPPVGAGAIFHLTEYFHGSGFWSTQPEPDPLPSLEQLVQNGIRGPTCVFIVADDLISQSLVNIFAEDSSSNHRRVKKGTEQAITYMQ
jgi:hypothetical protein